MHTNNTTRLYKYTDSEGAFRILQNQTLKFSSPLTFNDPFDTHISASLGMGTEEFLKELGPAFFEFSLSDLDYATLRPGPMADQVILINQSLKGASETQIAEMRAEIVNTSPEEVWDISRLEQTNAQTVEILRATFARYGIFCTSTKKDNLLMWSHYANHHRGVVLEISPSHKNDSALIRSRPVSYSSERPHLYRDAREMIKQALTMPLLESTKFQLERIIYTKSIDWSYEEEWRVYIPDFVPQGRNFEFLKLHNDEISAVYFGCRSSANDRHVLAHLAKRANSAVELYEMKMAARDYALTWEPFSSC